MYEIMCFNEYGNSINEFVQWDTNRVMYIDWEHNCIPIFQFGNTKSDRLLVVKGRIIEDETKKIAEVNVPNILLQQAYPIVGFVYLETEVDGNENYYAGQTVYNFKIPVRAKVKPEDYKYTENTEYISWINLESEARAYLAELEVETNRFKAEYEDTLGTANENANRAIQAAEEAKTSENNAKASENAAKASENAAHISEVAAKESEDAAKTSENNAYASELAANESENNAKSSENIANASENAAKLSETNAKVSEVNAKESEENSARSETKAKESEDKAKESENNAQRAESNAKTSEYNAKDSEIAAKASEDAARVSENNAYDSEVASKESENNAAMYANNAKASENAAKESENAASISENAAKVSENAARLSENAASTSATNAYNSEVAAKASEDIVAKNANAAKASENAAKTSETNAKASEVAAKASEEAAQEAAELARDKANEIIEDYLPLLDTKANKADIATTVKVGTAEGNNTYWKISDFGNWGTGVWYDKGFSMIITSRGGEMIWLSLAADDSNTSAGAIRLINRHSKIAALYHSVSESAIYVLACGWSNNICSHIISNVNGKYVPTITKASGLPSDAVNINIVEFGITDSSAVVGDESVALALGGSADRPTYNGVDLALLSDAPNATEDWVFTLEDGSTVTKAVCIK